MEVIVRLVEERWIWEQRKRSQDCSQGVKWLNIKGCNYRTKHSRTNIVDHDGRGLKVRNTEELISMKQVSAIIAMIISL